MEGLAACYGLSRDVRADLAGDSVTKPPGFRYLSAPIAEAVLDIQVEQGPDFELSGLRAFSDDEYVNWGESIEISSDFEHGAVGIATRSTRRTNGYRITTREGSKIALLRDSGFSFSWLSPYDSWAAFSSEGLRLWLKYRELASPIFINRLGLRYINQIVVPRERFRIDDYLDTRPEISARMPQDTTGYFMSVDVPLPDHEAVCRITQTILPRGEDPPILVLDLDAQRVCRYKADDDHAIVLAFDALREAKNLVFEASITDKSRELFQ